MDTTTHITISPKPTVELMPLQNLLMSHMSGLVWLWWAVWIGTLLVVAVKVRPRDRGK